jgi:hypothetical protein
MIGPGALNTRVYLLVRRGSHLPEISVLSLYEK